MILIVAAPLVAAYPVYQGAIDEMLSMDSLLSDSSIASDSPSPDDSSGDDYMSSYADYEAAEYRAKVKFLRDRVAQAIEDGWLTGSIAEEAMEYISTLTDEAIMSMSYMELEIAKEKLEYYLKVAGWDDDAPYPTDMDRRVAKLLHEIREKLVEVSEYRVKAELYGAPSYIDDLDRAEQLLEQAESILMEQGIDGYEEAWQLYLEAKLILESVDDALEHLYDD